MKHGWSNNGRRGRYGKGKGSAYTPREVPSNFSAVVAPMVVLELEYVKHCMLSRYEVFWHVIVIASALVVFVCT